MTAEDMMTSHVTYITLLAISFEPLDRFEPFLHQNDLYNLSCVTNHNNKMPPKEKMTSHGR